MLLKDVHSKVRDALNKSLSPLKPGSNQKTQNKEQLHLTGDLLASNDESFHFAPDFSLEDKSLNVTMLRCKPPAQALHELPAMKKASSVPASKQ